MFLMNFTAFNCAHNFLLSWIETNVALCLLCSYLAAKSEADHYNRELKREQEEIVTVPETGSYRNLLFYLF